MTSPALHRARAPVVALSLAVLATVAGCVSPKMTATSVTDPGTGPVLRGSLAVLPAFDPEAGEVVESFSPLLVESLDSLASGERYLSAGGAPGLEK